MISLPIDAVVPALRQALAHNTRPSWKPRRVPARPPGCRWPCSTSPGSPANASSCSNRDAWRRGAAEAAGRRAGRKGRRDRRLPDPPGEQGRPEDPHRSGHRGYPCPSPARRPGAGRCRPGDLRRIPRAQPGCRPGPGADSQWPRTVARRAAAESAGDVGDPGGRASCGAARRSAGCAARAACSRWISAGDGRRNPASSSSGCSRRCSRRWRRKAAACWSSSRPGRDPPRSRRLARGPWRSPRGAALPAAWRARLAAQRAAIEPASRGTRKVVLATNIAETSLTIDGVRVVIDAGLARCRASIRVAA